MNVKKHPNQARANARRQQILDAAEACFLENGFHGASMMVIARAAQMSPGHIYNYFESKEAIIAAIVEQHITASLNIDIENEQTFSKQNIIDILKKHIYNRIDNIADDPNCASLMFDILAESLRNPKMQSAVKRFDLHARNQLDMLCKKFQPTLTDEMLSEKIDVILLLFNGFALRISAQGKEVDRERYKDLTSKILHVFFT